MTNNKTPRGIRNNNPLNIRHSKDKWLGMDPVQGDPLFVSFIAMQYGYRAALKILRTYINKYQLCTPEKIIGRWAPPAENNTKAYIHTVCQQSGLKPTEIITMDNEHQIIALLLAMAFVETGQRGNISQIKEAYQSLKKR